MQVGRAFDELLGGETSDFIFVELRGPASGVYVVRCGAAAQQLIISQ